MKSQGKTGEQIKHLNNLIPEEKQFFLKKTLLTERGVTLQAGSQHAAGLKRKKTNLISQETASGTASENLRFWRAAASWKKN